MGDSTINNEIDYEALKESELRKIDINQLSSSLFRNLLYLASAEGLLSDILESCHVDRQTLLPKN